MVRKDVISITYADSIKCESEKPFKTLKKFFDNYLKDTINCIHVLPFFPYTSDDGFSVLDYSSVNEALGAWDDVEALSKNYKVMADVVINHCSARSQWFQNFQNQIHPEKTILQLLFQLTTSVKLCVQRKRAIKSSRHSQWQEICVVYF